MALPEAQRKLFKKQADDIVASVTKMEDAMAKMVSEKEALEAELKQKIAEKQTAIDLLFRERREHQEAVNQLMEMAGEEKPYDIPAVSPGRRSDYTQPARNKVKRVCPECGTTVYVGKARMGCPVESCPGKLSGEGKKTAGKGRVFRECSDCGKVSNVAASLRKCPKCGEKFDLDKTVEPPDDDDEDDDDEEAEGENLVPLSRHGKQPWESPGGGKVKKGCRRCERTVYVMPNLTTCPDEVCRGKLVSAK